MLLFLLKIFTIIFWCKILLYNSSIVHYPVNKYISYYSNWYFLSNLINIKIVNDCKNKPQKCTKKDISDANITLEMAKKLKTVHKIWERWKAKKTKWIHQQKNLKKLVLRIKTKRNDGDY